MSIIFEKLLQLKMLYLRQDQWKKWCVSGIVVSMLSKSYSKIKYVESIYTPNLCFREELYARLILGLLVLGIVKEWSMSFSIMAIFLLLLKPEFLTNQSILFSSHVVCGVLSEMEEPFLHIPGCGDERWLLIRRMLLLCEFKCLIPCGY